MAGIRWLGLLPFVMLVLAIPFVNRVHPIILGLPFLLFWIIVWVALSSVVLLIIYRLEPKEEE